MEMAVATDRVSGSNVPSMDSVSILLPSLRAQSSDVPRLMRLEKEEHESVQSRQVHTLNTVDDFSARDMKYEVATSAGQKKYGPTVPICHGTGQSEDDDFTLDPVAVSTHTLSTQQTAKISGMIDTVNAFVLKTFPNHQWRDFTLTSPLDSTKSPIAAYKQNGKTYAQGQLGATQLEPTDDVSAVPICKWTMPKMVSDAYKKRQRFDVVTGWSKAGGKMLSDKTACNNNVIVVQFHSGECCGFSKSHYHVLFGSQQPPVNFNWYKDQSKCAPWSRRSQMVHNVAGTLLHHIRTEIDGRTYLGCCHKLMLPVIRKMQAFIAANSWIPVSYKYVFGEEIDDPDDESCDEDMLGLGTALGKRAADAGEFPLPTKKVRDAIDEIMITQKQSSQGAYHADKRDIIEVICREHGCKDINQLQLVLHKLPRELGNVLHHWCTYDAKFIVYAIDNYWTEMTRLKPIEIAQYCVEHYLRPPQASKVIKALFTLPGWPQAILHTCALLLGWTAKRGALIIIGPGSCGKTMVFNAGMQWLGNVAQDVPLVGEKMLTGMHVPHNLLILDDCKPLIIPDNVDKLKNLFGGSPYKIDVKYGNIVLGTHCPCLWLMNRELNFVGVAPADEHAFKLRMTQVQLSHELVTGLEYKRTVEYLNYLWPLMITQTAEILSPDDIPNFNCADLIDFYSKHMLTKL